MDVRTGDRPRPDPGAATGPRSRGTVSGPPWRSLKRSGWAAGTPTSVSPAIARSRSTLRNGQIPRPSAVSSAPAGSAAAVRAAPSKPTASASARSTAASGALPAARLSPRTKSSAWPESRRMSRGPVPSPRRPTCASLPSEKYDEFWEMPYEKDPWSVPIEEKVELLRGVTNSHPENTRRPVC